MPKYWLVVISPENFTQNRDLGFTVDGFKDNRQGKRIYGMSPGDKVIYYINRIHKIGAVAEVSGQPYRAESKTSSTGKDEDRPLRVPMNLDTALDDHQLVDVRKLLPELSFVAERTGQTNWGMAFLGCVRSIPENDFHLIESEIRLAAHPSTEIDSVRPISEIEVKKAIMQLDLDATSLHDRIGEMLKAIGAWMGYNTYVRYKVTPEHSVELDVAWLRGKNPDVGIEVQIGGSIVEAKDRLDQARRFNYRKVIMVIEEDQLSKLNARIKFDELRFWLDAWSIQAVYRLYTSGQEFFSLYARLDESRYTDRQKLELVK